MHSLRSGDTNKARVEINKGSAEENLSSSELLPVTGKKTGVGEESERKRRGKRVQNARNVAREMMDGLNTRDRESISRSLEKMAGGHGL